MVNRSPISFIVAPCVGVSKAPTVLLRTVEYIEPAGNL